MAKPLRPSGDTRTDPGFAYHATNEERACDIARGGLRTHGPSYGTDQDAWPDGSREKRSYHAERASVVHSFAPEEGPAVILRARRDAHPFQEERTTRDLYTKKTIPASKLEIGLDDETWEPLPDWARKSC